MQPETHETHEPHEPPVAAFAFTKLVVDDLERLVAFYSDVYGLHAVHRVREHIGDDEIEEVMMSPDPSATWSSFVLLKFHGRAKPAGDEVILGFTTDDLPRLIERVEAAGGRVHAPLKELPEIHVRVAFVRDPEGHLTELVQVVA